MEKLNKQLNAFLYGEDLLKKLTILPKKEMPTNVPEKFVALNSIYQIFIPNRVTVDIYNRIYLSLLGALERKETVEETKLFINNFLSANGFKQNGICNGFNSFSITGESGIGKTSTIRNVINAITDGKVIYCNNGYREILPCLVVETPADSSFKQLLFQIMRNVDNELGTTYFENNNKATATIDLLLGTTANILNSHIGILIIDEIDRLANDNRNSEKLLNYLTQLCNISNANICFVGNTSALSYFSRKTYLSRRTIGITFNNNEYNEEFCNFLSILFDYQYTEQKAQLNSGLSLLFYQLTAGNPSVVVSLFVESQRYCLLNGIPKITDRIIKDTFNNYFKTLNNTRTCETKQFKAIQQKCEIRAENKHIEEDTELFKKVSKIANGDTNTAILFLNKRIAIEYA